MRALLFTLDFPPLGGGIARYNEGLARSWPAGELAVLAPDFPGSRAVDAGLSCCVYRRRFFTRIPTPHPARGIPAAWRAAREVIAAYRPDVLLCGQPLTTGLVGEALACGRPVVLFAHGEELRRHRGSRLRRALLRRALGRAARVVVVSEYGRDQASWHGVDAARIIKMTGIAPEYLADEEGALPGDLEARLARRRVLLTAGRLEARKGQDLAIEALARLQGAGEAEGRAPVLVVAGEGDRRAMLEARARELGVADRVIFTGRVSDAELRALYRRADLFLLAARVGESGEEEGLGLVIVEAAAAGTPAVGTRIGGIPEAIADGETGLLVNPEAPGELAEAVARLFADGELLAAMGERARRRARRDFDWRANAGRLRDLLAGDLLAGESTSS